MNIRKTYIDTIRRNCASPPNAIKDLSYWRNNLFAGMIISLLPLCVIALVPAIYWSFYTRIYLIAQVDIAVLVSVLVIAFAKGIPVTVRKIVFMITAYLLSCVLLYLVGLNGSGQLYLLIACVFSILIFPSRYSLWPSYANTIICALFALANHFKLLPWPDDLTHSTMAWIASASSVVFLSFLLSALIPKLFSGLQQTLRSEKSLAEKLRKEQESLMHAMKLLEEKNAELEQFTYAASHDLQEPLRMVTGFLGQVEKKYEAALDAQGKQYIWFAVDGAKRMQQLIMDLLEFSKIGRQRTANENVNLNKLVNEVCVLYRTEIETKKASIIFDPLPNIYTNKVALKQVLQNLISNSLKYSRPETPVLIKITATELAAHWEFCVSDNGIGIAPQNFEKVFIIFKRLHGRETYPGTGIGLAVTKKNIEQMGGQVWVTSEEGKGSSFYFTILKQADLIQD